MQFGTKLKKFAFQTEFEKRTNKLILNINIFLGLPVRIMYVNLPKKTRDNNNNVFLSISQEDINVINLMLASHNKNIYSEV